jgi:hypothetical protein
MATLSYSQLEGVWTQAGGDPSLAPLMAAIAEAESSGDPTATNPTDNNGTQTSWGLWQISNGDHSEPDPNWADPLTNARLALAKYRSPQGLGAWGTYTSGAYRNFLQGGVAPSSPPTGDGGGGAPLPGSPGAVPAINIPGVAQWLIPLLQNFNQASPGSGLAGIMGTVLGPISNTFQDFSHALTSAMTAVLWLINPMNWVRIFAGAAGFLIGLTGLFFVARSA